MADTAKAASLAERLVAGDKRALARAITLIESDDPAGWELVREVYPRTGTARIIGFTGPPGVGKSTLIGALTAELRKADRQVAVLSIDPSSPFTRGALLGDRIRLSDHFLDPGVFIRSMASRGALGGLSEAALQVALVMDAAGKDDVLIETVGVGQAEIDIVDHADTIVLALMPGSGDSIQALKAGVMEIPDIIVVNKADHPMTDTMVREVRGVLALSHDPEGWNVPILRTEAARARGSRSWRRRSTSIAPTSRRRGPWMSGGRATCATRSSGSPPRGCAAGSRRPPPRTPRPSPSSTGSSGGSSIPPAPPPSCSSGRPMTESLIGFEVDDRDGSRVGVVRGLFTDTESGDPAWLIVALGRRRARLVAVPFSDCAPAAGRVWVAHGRDALRSAPSIDPTRPLLREHELTICAHYGIGRAVGRAAAVAGRTEGTTTSGPA